MPKFYYDPLASSGGGVGLVYSPTARGILGDNWTPHGNTTAGENTLPETTIRATRTNTTKSGIDLNGVFGGLINNLPGIIGAFNGNQQPQNVTHVTQQDGSGNTPGNGKTLLYIALGVAALVILFIVLKK